MIARMIFWLLALPLFVAIVVFAVVNPGLVELNLWPLAEATIAFPIYGVGLAGLVLGFLLGATAAWLSSGRVRRQLRAAVRQSETDQHQMLSLREQLDKLKTDSKPAAALPPRDAA